jgi:uncharacterized membrane protein
MSVLVAGLIILLGVHMTRLIGVRALAVRVIGEPLWAVFYSVLSAIGLALTIYGHILAHPSETVWNPPAWTRTVALAAVPVSIVLLVATYVPSHIRAFTRHPMTLGVFLWSGAHLLANGEIASLVLFGAFFAWSAVLLIEGYARGGHFAHAGSWAGDAGVILLGLAAAGALALFHMQLFGVAVVGFASDSAPPGI